MSPGDPLAKAFHFQASLALCGFPSTTHPHPPAGRSWHGCKRRPSALRLGGAVAQPSPISPLLLFLGACCRQRRLGLPEAMSYYVFEGQGAAHSPSTSMAGSGQYRHLINDYGPPSLGYTQGGQITGSNQVPQSKYAELLTIIEELGKEIRPTYAGSKSAMERLKRGIIHARGLVRECLAETERNARS